MKGFKGYNEKKVGIRKNIKCKIVINASTFIVCAYIAFLATNISFLPNKLVVTSEDIKNIRVNNFTWDIDQEVATVSNIEIEPVKDNIQKTEIEPEIETEIETDLETDLETELTENNVETITETTEQTKEAKMTIKSLGVPLKEVELEVIPEIELVPGGMAVGVQISSDGVMVLGTGTVNGEDGQIYNPSYGILESGDLILKVDGISLSNKSDLINYINKNSEVELEIKRNDEIVVSKISSVKSLDDGKNKIGVWVRDSTEGIGTITYYNPESNNFAALGHGILDVDTNKLMAVKSGKIMYSSIKEIKMGEKGSAGELIGDIDENGRIGQVKLNNQFGIYGKMDFPNQKITGLEKMQVAFQNSVHEGPAIIRANIDKDEIKEYDIYIENSNRLYEDSSKSMTIRITDPELLSKTNGIVQGMSGSPIIQDGKIIGAVTHVFLQDPTKGYGVFIEKMLEQEKYIS